MRPRISVEQSIHRLLSNTTAVTGIQYLEALVRSTAEVLQTKYAFIGRIQPSPTRVRSLAYWNGHQIAESFEYELEGTPCAEVMSMASCQYPFEVQCAFPDDEMLAEMGIQAYFGIPIISAGRCLGVLVGLDDRPRRKIPSLELILKLFSDRAAVEIERMEAKQALQHSERRYRQIVTHCGEGVWTFDEDGKTTFANEQMAAMLGIAADDMLGRPMLDFMDDEAQALAARNTAQGQERVRERHACRLTHGNGSSVFTETSTSPIYDDDGKYTGALALVTDISERMRLEASVQQKQKLESFGLMAGGVAHDFSNLLVGILTNTDLALAAPPGSKRVERALHDVQRASRHASDLTRQLLAYSGGGHMQIRSLDINALITDTVEMVRATLAPGVVLKVDSSDPPPTVRGDRGQLTQVLMNLVVNANDALAGGPGQIAIATGTADPGDPMLQQSYVADALGTGAHAWIRVSDTGDGMGRDVIQNIFDPFFSTKDSGHGLGLAPVLGILKRHDGNISIESTPGRGSTFTVLIPAADAVTESDSATELEQTTKASNLRGHHILITDDQPMVSSAARQFLLMEGAEVEVANNGIQALERLSQGGADYDLLLLDMSMPGLSGIETLRRLRQRGDETPVLMMSGHSATELPFEDGTAFLGKPFGGHALLLAVYAALKQGDGHRGSGANVSARGDA